MDFIEPCFGIGHNLSLICQMTSEDIKHQLIIKIRVKGGGGVEGEERPVHKIYQTQRAAKEGARETDV